MIRAVTAQRLTLPTLWQSGYNLGLGGISMTSLSGKIAQFALDLKYDDIPEQAFSMKGGIQDVVEAAEKMKAEVG